MIAHGPLKDLDALQVSAPLGCRQFSDEGQPFDSPQGQIDAILITQLNGMG